MTRKNWKEKVSFLCGGIAVIAALWGQITIATVFVILSIFFYSFAMLK